MHLIKLRFPACCKRIGLFSVQPACLQRSCLEIYIFCKVQTASVIMARINKDGENFLYIIYKNLIYFVRWVK